MKNKHLKAMAIGLALAISSQTALACTTAPKPNVDTTKPNAEENKTKPEDSAAKPKEAEKLEETEKAKEIEKPKEVTKPAKPPKEQAPNKQEGDCKKDATDQKKTKDNFVIDNFKVISMTLEKLGVPQDELQQMIKDGKKLPEVLEAKNIKVSKFKKTLIKYYNKAINEGVEKGQLTKEEGKMLKQAIKQKVMKWLECQS